MKSEIQNGIHNAVALTVIELQISTKPHLFSLLRVCVYSQTTALEGDTWSFPMFACLLCSFAGYVCSLAMFAHLLCSLAASFTSLTPRICSIDKLSHSLCSLRMFVPFTSCLTHFAHSACLFHSRAASLTSLTPSLDSGKKEELETWTIKVMRKGKRHEN